MTVLFAYASQRATRALLCADDREPNANRRADKLSARPGRFVLGFHGRDAGQIGYEMLIQFDGWRWRNGDSFGVTSFDQLLRELWPIVDRVTAVQKRSAATNPQWTTLMATEWEAQPVGVIAIDRNTFALHHAVRRDGHSPEVITLEDGRVYRFGVNGRQTIDVAPPEEGTYVHWATARISETRAELAPHGLEDKVGDLGALFWKTDAHEVSRTSFDTIDDYLTSVGY